MPFTVKKIADRLPEEFTPAIHGDDERMVYAAHRFQSEASDASAVYFAPLEQPPEDTALPVILVREERIDASLAIARRLIARDYRRSVELPKLQQAILQNAEDDVIVTICRAIMDNPLWIVDSHLNPVAFSVPEENAAKPGYTPMKNYIGSATEMVELLPPDQACSSERIVGSIVSRKDRSMGFIIVLNIECPFDAEVDLEFASHICAILTGWRRLQNLLTFQNANADFIDDLLQLRITDPLIINQQMRALKWPVSEKYYVIVIERTPSEQLVSIRTELCYALRRELYIYGRYYLAVINCPLRQRMGASDFRSLIALLSKYQMRAALSNGFTNFADLPNAFSQALECLKFRTWNTHSLHVFCRYEDRLVSHLIRIAANQGVNLLAMCDPIMVALLMHDREHGTEDFKTIAAYIFNGLNLKDTAAALYIHRNTAYRRLLTLKEQYQLDLESSAELERLKMSVIILTYLGMADVEGYISQPDIVTLPNDPNGP